MLLCANVSHPEVTLVQSEKAEAKRTRRDCYVNNDNPSQRRHWKYRRPQGNCADVGRRLILCHYTCDMLFRTVVVKPFAAVTHFSIQSTIVDFEQLAPDTSYQWV